MSSTESAAPEGPLPGRLFYCHRCTHQWRKLEESEFHCPQCQEGFIEDINDTAISPVQPAPAAERMDALTQILRRLPSESRARSRSPRSAHNFSSFMLAASDLGAISGSSSSSGSSSGARLEFPFDLEDLMSSFLATPRPSPTAQVLIDEIPVLVVTEEHVTTQCSICFEEYLVNEPKVRQMLCKHIFHEECLFPWLRINGSCPVCRSRLVPGTEEDDTPPARDAARYDDILRFMRQRGVDHRVAGESSNSNNIPPQYAIRGRPRGSSSGGRQPRFPLIGPNSRETLRMIARSAVEESVRENSAMVHEMGMQIFREMQDAEAAVDFSERRRRAVRYNFVGTGSEIPTLRTAAAAVRARSLISGRRNRRNQSNAVDEEEEVISIRARTDPSTFRTVFEILPGPGEPTPEEAARERARRERDHRNERRNRIMESASSPDIQQEMASVFSGLRRNRTMAPALPMIDLTSSVERPVVPPPTAVMSSDSSSSATTSSSESSSQLASPLSAITSEEESTNFLGTIGQRTSSNEE